MDNENKVTQSKVGLFILAGLLTIGLMVVYFGRMGEGMQNYYTLRVEFPNASGLMRGSEVLLAGAKIGRVTNDPIILPDMNGVYVNLRIFEGVEIPSLSEFSVGSSGLLGDKFVKIDLKPNARESKPIAPDTTIQGVSESGDLGAITEDAGALIQKLQAAVDNINSISKKIDKDVLDEEGLKTITETIKNLRTTSTEFAKASARMDGLVTDAGTAIKDGRNTMDAAKKAADELQRALSDIRGLVRDVRQGQGALGTLMTDKETAANLRALVSNLRRYGLLWYRDGEKAKRPGSEQ